jgi:Holliday junction DNA helicase RuvA
MFNSIQGTITEKKADAVHISTGGVEWDIAVPGMDMSRIGNTGDQGRVFVWLYHREDQMRLYGFADERRRSTFLELMKVEGIGPRQALKILSGIRQEDLERALDDEDLARLEAVPGLGKKTAQKMILTLKGKIARDSSPVQTDSAHGELINARVDMGYDRKAASEAVAKAAAEFAKAGEGGPVPAEREKLLFKRAILLLSGA